MADEDKDGTTKKSKLPLIIAAVVVLAGGGGAAFFFLGGEGGGKAPKAGAAKAAVAGEIGPVMPLEIFIVNLNEPGATRYLKIQMDLEMTVKPVEAHRKLTVRLRDRVIMYLSSLSIADVQKEEAKQAIKAKILEHSNSVFGKGTVVAVYFRAFVLQ